MGVYTSFCSLSHDPMRSSPGYIAVLAKTMANHRHCFHHPVGRSDSEHTFVHSQALGCTASAAVVIAEASTYPKHHACLVNGSLSCIPTAWLMRLSSADT